MLPQTSNDLNSFLFSTPEMSHTFSAGAQLRAMMRFEWALTCALEKNGWAECGSGSVLESLLDANFIDVSALQRDAMQDGNLAIPFVRQLTVAVKEKSESAARSIHLGATSQDLLDTALILQIRDALKLIEVGMAKLETVLAQQIKKHAGTLLAGRTWLQVGPPTTLGLKFAGTLAAIRRTHVRLHACTERLLVLQFGGAVGTRSALGNGDPPIAADLARTLDLKEPSLPWHTQRDNLVEIVQILALLTGSFAKFSRDISLLMQSEIGEVSEGGDTERGGSSTMPHKHNPIACAAVLAVHTTMPGLAATMLTAMPQEHERGLGSWQAEWETVPEAFRRAAAALAYSVEIAEHLQVDAERMRANLDASLGLPMAEAVSVALTPAMGRFRAHDHLRQATERAKREKRHLSEVLKNDPEITKHLDPEQIDQLLDPENYLGSAQEFIRRVLGEANANS
jgi:3-carboxy-cis,cis-muconate cycloisomerase